MIRSLAELQQEHVVMESETDTGAWVNRPALAATDNSCFSPFCNKHE